MPSVRTALAVRFKVMGCDGHYCTGGAAATKSVVQTEQVPPGPAPESRLVSRLLQALKDQSAEQLVHAEARS